MITITLGSTAYISELVQLSEQVGGKPHTAGRKKIILSQHQNYPSPKHSSYNSPSSGSRVGRAGGTSERPKELSGPATLGQVADVGGS